MKEWLLVIISAIIALAVLVMAVLLPLRFVRHWYDAKYCPVKLEALSREGKFVDYNFWDWNCLAKTDSGKYVTIDRLLNVSEDSQ